MDLAGLSTQNEHNLAGVTVLEARSRVTQSRVYAGVGDVVTVVEALGVDPKEHFDAVPSAFGDPGRGNPRAQPQRHRRVAQVVGPPGQA
jgi:hypothetical protein